MTDINSPLKRYFLGWQCRIRQQAVRNDEGRPCEGMRAGVYVSISERNLGPVVINIALSDCVEITSEFQHVVKKTHDPKLRRDSALKILQSAYYQYPAKFDGALYATFAVDSELADVLVSQQECRLAIQQYNQTFDLHCGVEDLPVDDDKFQVTYWHNKMFNATMPARVRILKFLPDWDKSVAEPGVQAA